MLKMRYFTCILMLLLCAGCGSSKSDSDKSVRPGDVVATINDYNITSSEFNALIKFESEVDPEFQITMGNRKKFLDYLIQKQLYIQEASKLKLDQKEAFVRSIEKYWESTLIRQLLDLKSREFKEKVLVTKEEIEAVYEQNRKDFEGQPLKSVEDQIMKAITGKRIAQMNQVWTDELKRSARINIDEEFFMQVSSEKSAENISDSTKKQISDKQ